MKLLRVISTIDPRDGGPSEGARKIDSELIKLGHSTEVLTLDGPNEKFIAEYPTAVHALGPSSGGYRYNGKIVKWLRVNAHKYDAVIVNGIWQYHSFAVWRALSGIRAPYFVFSHGMLDPWFRYKYPIKHLKKWLYWPWAEYRVLRDASAVIFTCEEERLLARKSFWLYKTNEAVTSYGTSTPPTGGEDFAAQFVGKHPELQGKRIVLFLGRIHEKKGCDLLLASFAEVSKMDERLHLVMAGPDKSGWGEKLRNIARRLGMDQRILWAGMLQGDEKWGAFHSAEVFCLPSHQENFGIAVAEALACGKPVLISNKVNIWREIENDGVGFVDDASVAGTTRNLKRWLSLTNEDYRKMSVKARRSFDERFHIRRAAERLVEIISEGKLR
ncbi:glycosyltransferase [Cupriavidus sp. KK10]|jgi:glycosyltransferase involved in cell wall biosynthesis|uniref:glycosyltransferase n=1 Tax=Cupriavidus sp. KK10 TaxID=1478019 RepID=UPI001BAC626A|nr:glycosyltransferase [Cupriavidus sp. KK10]QUN30588.1 glycosyltransferase [Cupriavidus sp. KK10]